jgi:predicted transcriptional regulator
MSFKIEFDTSQRGLRMVLKDWEEEVMRAIWGSPQKELTTKAVWDQVNQRLGPGGISRASVINFLEDMASMGVLNRREITGKGGYRGVYSSEMDESGFRKFVAKTVIEALVRSFLDETRQAMEMIS